MLHNDALPITMNLAVLVELHHSDLFKNFDIVFFVDHNSTMIVMI